MRLMPLLPIAVLALSCVDTEDIDTTLKRHPDRASVRVLSLVRGIDLTLTREDESPVAFSNAESLSTWRTQVAGEVTAYLTQAGTMSASAEFVLKKDSRATVLVTMDGEEQTVATIEETRVPEDARAHVRFLHGANTATLEGLTLGTEWSQSVALDDATLTLDIEGVEHRFGPLKVNDGELVTLAVLSGEEPRLLVAVERAESETPLNTVLDENE